MPLFIKIFKKVHLKSNEYLLIQFKAHLAFCATQGIFSIALNNLFFSFESLTYVSKSKLYISIENGKEVKNQLPEAWNDAKMIMSIT